MIDIKSNLRLTSLIY